MFSKGLLMKNVGTKDEVEKKTVKASKTEIYIRRILGILLIVLIFGPLVFLGLRALPIYGAFLLTVPFAIVISIYLLTSKKYHLILDIFLVLLGVLVYYTPPHS